MKTVFLDRDGVINKRLIGDYVKRIEEFEFLDGVLDAIKLLKEHNYRIIIITNQQGIGKKLMSEEDLNKIHSFMIKEIEKNGGKVDKIYYCPHLENENCNCRKPKPGMIEQALKDYPDINKENTFMIGDTESDVKLAKNAGLRSIIIGEEADPDFRFKSLLEATMFLVREEKW